MLWKILLAVTVFFSPYARAESTAPEDERITKEFAARLSGKEALRLIPGIEGARRSRLALDAIETAIAAGKKIDLPSIIPSFAWPQLEPKERARWFRLGAISEEELATSIAGATAESGLLYELLTLEPRLHSPSSRALLNRITTALPEETRTFRARSARTFTPPSTAEVRSVFFDLPDITHFENGAYAGKPRLFLFCRHDRHYACILAMKDKDDHPVRKGSGLWTQAGLGLSGYEKPFNERMGNTPSGVHLINGVMPTADDLVSFGRFRRMILEFPPASSGEADMKRLLPPATYASSWWKEVAIARDMGRGELRIHGTGEHNDHPEVLFYPFIATIGCVAQREMKYGSTDYTDQRLLLDQLMRAQGLEAKYENETQIRALLYVIDIDDRAAPVSTADLARYDIK